MCGIFGQIGQEPIPGDHLVRQTRILAHRGPDGAALALFVGLADEPELYADRPTRNGLSTWQPLPHGRLPDSRIALGHLRLAIVELSDLGRQPMASADNALWIVFNGEIYNHVELRDELVQLGHRRAGERVERAPAILVLVAAQAVGMSSRAEVLRAVMPATRISRKLRLDQGEGIVGGALRPQCRLQRSALRL